MSQAAPSHTRPVEGLLRTRAAPWWIAGGALALAFGLLIVRAHELINRDCAMYLQCAQLMAAGQVPYVDFVEINPPWIMYAMLPVVWVARGLAVPVVPVFQFAVAALITLSWLELRWLLGRSAMALMPAETGTLSIAWLAASIIVWRYGDLGQREHLFMLLYVRSCCCARCVTKADPCRWVWRCCSARRRGRAPA